MGYRSRKSFALQLFEDRGELLLNCLLLVLASSSSGCQGEKSSRTSPKDASAALAPAPSSTPGENAGGTEAVAQDVHSDESLSASRPEEEEKGARRYVVAALGDSITDARSGGGGYLKKLREACPRSQFHNFGKGGDMTNQMRRRWQQEILGQVQSLGLTTLLVYGGVNDLYSDLTANRKNDRIEDDLISIYRSAKEAGLEVVGVTVSPWGGFSRYFTAPRGQNTQLLNSWIMGQVATGFLDKAVDSYAPLSCGDRAFLCPEYETASKDGLHLGEKGHEILGKKLLSEAFSDCL